MNNSKEIWKDIQGYEGLYQISNLGRVKSIKRTVIGSNGAKVIVPERIKKLSLKDNGYLATQLYKKNKSRNVYIHRLVAEAFIPNQSNLPTVNHKDGNKHNNTISNLEWLSYSDNNQHAYNHGLTHSNKNNPHMSKRVTAYSLDGKKLYSFPSMREAGRQLQMSGYDVTMAIKHGWHYHGLVWKLEK